jgi:hypothetical protein
VDNVTNDLVSRPERLERALNAPVLGREHNWARELAGALIDLEHALRRHAADSKAPSGVFAEVDTTRRGLVKQVGALRGKASMLLDQTKELNGYARQLATTTKERGPSFGTLVSRAAQLLGGVRELLDGEVDVVMESLNADLGAGD